MPILAAGWLAIPLALSIEMSHQMPSMKYPYLAEPAVPLAHCRRGHPHCSTTCKGATPLPFHTILETAEAWCSAPKLMSVAMSEAAEALAPQMRVCAAEVMSHGFEGGDYVIRN